MGTNADERHPDMISEAAIFECQLLVEQFWITLGSTWDILSSILRDDLVQHERTPLMFVSISQNVFGIVFVHWLL